MTTWAPTYPIRTERLDLRPHVADDLDDLVVFHGDADVIRYIPWPVRDRAQTEVALAAKLGQGVAQSEGDWLVLAIVLRDEHRVIGEVLLKRADDAARDGELGYVIGTAWQGLGLAGEAASAMLRLAFDEFGLDRVVARLDPANDSSARLLERLGFARATELDEPPTTITYAIRRAGARA